MMFGYVTRRLSRSLLAISLSLLLGACGGGGTEAQGSASSQPIAAASSTPIVTTSASKSPSSTSKSSSSRAASSIRSSTAMSSVTAISSSPNSEFPDDTEFPVDDSNAADMPPSAPRALRLLAVTAQNALLSWDASTDDVGLSRYEIRRDGIAISTTNASNLEFEDTNLKANTYYTYTVRAIDIAGHRSNFSNSLIVKTAAAGSATSSAKSSTQSSSGMSSSLATTSASSSSQTSSGAPSSASSSSIAMNGNLRVTWTIPSQRENGTYLELHEISGYEIRYKPANSSSYISEIINSNTTTQLARPDFTSNTIVLIAAFDTNGLYSRFVQLTPK
uniref:fibronectin type III domain-containing protein n=1 Tax=Cellvibrio fontiphilus TaxID=1815559 RepID=UPI002B4BD904|nr:hypothetical protein [Cellvibrio fontiphilus]